MIRTYAIGLIVVFLSTLDAQTINLRGKVSNGAGQPVPNAVVELMLQGKKDTTGADGSYSFTGPVPVRPNSSALSEDMRLVQGVLEFRVSTTSPLKIEVFDINGNIQKKEVLPKALPGVYHFDIANSPHSNEMLIVQASMGGLVQNFRYFPLKKVNTGENYSFASTSPADGILAKIAAAVDTLKVSAAGFVSKKTGLDSYDATVNVTVDAEPIGTVPKVTPSNATSIPAMYGNAVANPGKLATKVMYPAYWYSTNAPSSEAFKSTPSIPKQTTAIQKPCNVYTPPGYDPQTEYPLIIIMHGITDNENTWNERANPKIATLFDNLITSKATKPFIAVFALGTVNNTTNGYYAFGAELINDLLPFIESKYSVKKDRGSRAMAGFSFGGMQTINIGLCAHLKEFAWFAGLDAAGGNANSTDIAKYVAAQNPEKYPLYYFYVGVGASDGTAKGSSAASANGLTTKGPYITTANFSYQENIPGGHVYPTAEVSLYNFLRMAFSPNY
ncbi:MAG: alpha/beta hydrolase-fold protein [Fibrobacteria bacterium]